MGLGRKWLAFVMVILPAGLQGFGQEDHTGWLQVLWGDNHQEDSAEVHQVFLLTKETGETIRLNIDLQLLAPLGGAGVLSGRKVTVTGSLLEDDPRADQLAVSAIWLQGDGVERGISGSKPWISILLKFSDIADEPRDLAFFSGMYGNVPGQLDHYWREVSSENINVVGSVAVDWVDLPQAQTFYVPSPGSGSNANLSSLFNDAIAAVDASVDFSNGGSGGYEGINIMFNGLLDCCAWGGTRFATIDGVSKVWRVTWEPPWGYTDEGVIAHEMGHGFGLPHCNNSDGDTNPYDNPWDVMSAATSYAVSDGTYGRLGKHVNAYHKNRLGWIPAGEMVEVLDTSMSLTLDHLALQSTSNFRMVTVPIGGSSTHYYTIEVRDQFGNYDGNVAGNAVLIYEVLTSRSEPSWLVDGDAIPATFSDNEGVMWRVGETFNDAGNDISIEVVSATADGFVISVSNNDAGCVYAISPSSESFDESGGNDSIAVTVGVGCAWTAVSNNGWVTVSGGASGSGNGTVSYTVAANTSISARVATITAAGQTFTVNQTGESCAYAINPGAAGFVPTGGSATVAVTAQSGCAWTAVSNDAWITVTGGASGSGNGTVSYSVAANTAIARNGSISIGPDTFDVTQSAFICDYAMSPGSATISAGGGSGSLALTAQSGCAWTAVSNNSWITVTSGGSGSGNGMVTYTVDTNISTGRLGTMSIAGEFFIINQSAACILSQVFLTALPDWPETQNVLTLIPLSGCD